MNPHVQEKFIEQLVERVQQLESRINNLNVWFLLQVQSYRNKIESLEKEIRSLQITLNVLNQRWKKANPKKSSLFQ